MMKELHGVLKHLNVCVGDRMRDGSTDDTGSIDQSDDDNGAAENTCRDAIEDMPMLQNAWLGVRKGKDTEAFIAKWLQWNVDDRAIRAMPFADQSVFELLAYEPNDRLKLFALRAADMLWPQVLTRDSIGVRDTPANKV